jgi:hypothetical protein
MIISASMLLFIRLLSFLMVSATAMGLEQPPLSELIRAADDQPIQCYVRFLDQDGQAVVGVPIKAHIWTYNPDRSTASAKDIVGLTTDASGLVAIENEHGSALRLTVDSDKYSHGFYDPRVSPGVVLLFSKVGGNGSLRHGTPKVPADYFVWRKEGPQALVSLTGELRLDHLRNEICLDLVTGQLVDDGGDLVIRVQMAESEVERKKATDHRGYFPHEITLSVISGGLAHIDESVDLSDYAAIPGIWAKQFPDTTMEGQASLSYQDGKDVSFTGYLRARDGKIYGKIKLLAAMERYWRVENGRFVIKVETLLNTSGSRSLEPDPAKLTKLTLTDARKKSEAEPKKP